MGGSVAQSLYLILTTSCFPLRVLRKRAPRPPALPELHPKSISLENMGACFLGAKGEPRAHWAGAQRQDYLCGAEKALVLSYASSMA